MDYGHYVGNAYMYASVYVFICVCIVCIDQPEELSWGKFLAGNVGEVERLEEISRPVLYVAYKCTYYCLK